MVWSCVQEHSLSPGTQRQLNSGGQVPVALDLDTKIAKGMRNDLLEQVWTILLHLEVQWERLFRKSKIFTETTAQNSGSTSSENIEAGPNFLFLAFFPPDAGCQEDTRSSF